MRKRSDLDVSVSLANRETVPAIGQGTWRLGEDPASFWREVEALRLGIELGLTLIDTAEMYADGRAEQVVAEAIADLRARVFLVTKVWHTHLQRKDALDACQRSLDRLRVDYVDAYLVHWPSASVSLAETLGALVELRARGRIRHIGVCNFPTPLLQDAVALLGDTPLTFNQVPYSLARREVEPRLLPYCREHGITVMAYHPVKRLPSVGPGRRALERVARRHGATPEQVALAWLIDHPGVVAIPKAVRPEHIRANAAALQLRLSVSDREELERAFPVLGQELELHRY